MLGKVEICGVNTAQLPRLSAEETEALLAKARAGDADAREKLISGKEDSTPADFEAVLKELGFSYAALDLGGYEKGKMNKSVVA